MCALFINVNCSIALILSMSILGIHTLKLIVIIKAKLFIKFKSLILLEIMNTEVDQKTFSLAVQQKSNNFPDERIAEVFNAYKIYVISMLKLFGCDARVFCSRIKIGGNEVCKFCGFRTA